MTYTWGWMLFYLKYGFHNIGELHRLKGHVCYAALIEDAYRLFINHGEAGVAPAKILIKQQLVLLREGQTSVEAGLDGDQIAVLCGVGIGE